MPIFRVAVTNRLPDQRYLEAARHVGINALLRCEEVRLFFLGGELTHAQVEQISSQLLADPIVETFSINAQHPPCSHFMEVTLLPGVTDSAAENQVLAVQRMGIPALEEAATGQAFLLEGGLTPADLERLATQVFSNPVIQQVSLDQPISPPFIHTHAINEAVETIALIGVSDAELMTVNTERRLALDLAEMQAIRAYFEGEGRNPTDAELEMLAQTWSEHCVHKTFKADITYSENNQPPRLIHGLLRSYIRAATEKLQKPWVRSAFVDNAGIVAFDEQYDLAFKVETHNHPSALEPFGGANTGVGGVIRDVLGVSARPIANTDVLCFGNQDLPDEKLPTGVLHPRRVQAGVVHGIEDYGNKMGIPTVNGAIYYHTGYTANPLVFCGCLGLLPHGSHPSQVQDGDLIIVLGGRTGRDGLRGATFSSMEMDQTTGLIAGSAVQIGHAIHEKQVQEVLLRARDERLYHAVTDCGAGGLSSAVGEMAAGVGAEVQLEAVPLKYMGLPPWEIWLSEAQERMVLAVPPQHWGRLQELAQGQDIEATHIGTFRATGRLKLTYLGKPVGDLSIEFLHEGIPTRQLTAVWETPPVQSAAIPEPANYNALLLKLLGHPNIRSKEDVIRRYDHEVQSGTAVKPLTGIHNHAPSDGSVLVPLDAASPNAKGVALSVGLCPQYGELDPYAMAWAAVDEALRNLVAMGADPDQVAILDNFCWGNPLLPDRLGALVRCVEGCHDAALAYQTPFVSGKDSLNNEYLGDDGQRHAIPGTLLISAMGIVPDVTKTVTMDLKTPGNLLFLLGETHQEMGGSHFNLLQGLSGGTVPQPAPRALELLRKLHQAIQQGLVEACHDCSEGGLGVALAEMCIGGGLGAQVNLEGLPPQVALFAESLGRFVVEVAPKNSQGFHKLLADMPYTELGTVSAEPILRFGGIVNLKVTELGLAFGSDAVLSSHVSQARLSSPTSYPTLARSPRILILHANGTNRDRDAALACELAGGSPEIVHINQLLGGEKALLDYHMVVIPGGFSYGDDLGAGVLFAQTLYHRLGEQLQAFIAQGRPVLGICNGFQTLVKTGLLSASERDFTLTYNERHQFECRWVYLKPNPASPCLFTQGLDDPIYCPVAHGEGRIQANDEATYATWQAAGLIALTYSDVTGNDDVAYPLNPNGSALGIAGLTNAAGNVLGLMPHPENHIFPWQHPRWQRGEAGLDGLRLFKNGVLHA